MTGITRHFTPDDRAASLYQYLPFEVPAGIDGVTMTLAYDHQRAIVDLGLEGPERFIGWSGGERSTVTVTPQWATPGYRPGVAAGTWNVVLGLHRVGATGVDVTVDIELHRHPPAEPPTPPRPAKVERRPPRNLPAAPGRTWFACDFHSHTVHSDGGYTVDELAAHAVERGLDVLAVTDHNTVSHHPFLAAAGDHADVLLLPGQEVTTDEGHANCFGDVGWIDFRRPADEWRAHADRHGGLFSVNHPWEGDCAWRKPLAEPAPFVEMWHTTWDRLDPEPLDDRGEFGVTPIGGSDFHRAGGLIALGNPTTWIEAEERSVDAILAAMSEGRIAISAAPDFPVLLRRDGELVAVDADDCRQVVDERGARLVTSTDGRTVAFTR